MTGARRTVATLLGGLLLLIAALALVACGEDEIGGGNEGEVTVAAAEGEPRGDLAISNWALYIDPDTIGEYEGSSGVSVDYVEEINSYDSFFSKMQPLLERGESGDRSLMVASDWLAKKMYDLGYIQRLDQEALEPAFSHLSPAVKPPSSDPDWNFSIPWQGGMTGLIVNEEEREAEVRLDRWQEHETALPPLREGVVKTARRCGAAGPRTRRRAGCRSGGRAPRRRSPRPTAVRNGR